MTIGDVMVRGVGTIEASATLVEAARRMREANVGILPVVEAGAVRGVVTDRELVVRAIAGEADARATRVGGCATAEPLVAHTDWDADEALELMARHQVGRLPVVDIDDRPIGIVTLSSLALRAREDDDALAAAKEVSRRSARGARGPAAGAERSGQGQGAARRAGQKSGGPRRAAARTKSRKRRTTRAR
jgi:CBS domain-containing protein